MKNNIKLYYKSNNFAVYIYISNQMAVVMVITRISQNKNANTTNSSPNSTSPITDGITLTK
jgi:hypothetical protein